MRDLLGSGVASIRLAPQDERRARREGRGRDGPVWRRRSETTGRTTPNPNVNRRRAPSREDTPGPDAYERIAAASRNPAAASLAVIGRRSSPAKPATFRTGTGSPPRASRIARTRAAVTSAESKGAGWSIMI